MIDFSVPENVAAQVQMTRIVAEQVMRPKAGYYDEHEHERPMEYINMIWPVVADQQKASLEKRASQPTPDSSDNSSEEFRPKRTSVATIRTLHLVEQLAWGDVAQYLCTPSAALGGTAVEAVGTPDQRERFLTRFADAKARPVWGAMAMTEPGAGSDTSAIQTTAVLSHDGKEWILNGEKIFCTSGGLALNESNGFVVVWATIDRKAGRAGMKPFVVEAGTPGVAVTKAELKHGIRASDTVAIVLSDAHIPYENILGSPEIRQTDDANVKGFKGAMKTFDASRPVVAASAIGVARAALELTKEKLTDAGITISYTTPPHKMSAIERDVIEMEAELKASWLLTLRAGSMMDRGIPNALESSMCKAKAGEAGTRICQKCVEILGPMGYSRDWLVEKLMRDSKIADIYEGTHQINQLIIARRVLGYSSSELR